MPSWLLLLLLAGAEQYILDKPIARSNQHFLCDCRGCMLAALRVTSHLSALNRYGLYGPGRCRWRFWAGFRRAHPPILLQPGAPLSLASTGIWPLAFRSTVVPWHTGSTNNHASVLVDLKSAGALRALMNVVLPLNSFLLR